MSSPKSPSIQLHRERFPERPVFDTAVSHAMLRRVAAGATPESLRLYRPGSVMLFSSLDMRRPGFALAVEVAREAGFGPVIRLAGGHAAAFLEESLAFAWASRDPEARLQIRPRFERWSGVVVRALRRLGLDARVGEVAGEYCPGEFSVNLAGRVKVMGVGQRVIRDAAHVGGVLTLGQSEELREVLIRVYEALDLAFQPGTAGGIGDFDDGIGVEDVVASMEAVLAEEGQVLVSTGLEAELLEAAELLMPMHDVDSLGARKGRGLTPVEGKTLFQADRIASGPGDEETEES